MNTYDITFIIAIIAIIAIIGLIFWLLSLIAKKLHLTAIANFLKPIGIGLMLIVAFVTVIIGVCFAICGIALLAEYVTNFLFTLFS